VTRDGLIELLNEDLAREYQAIISYIVYSQVIKGSKHMNIAAELAVHADRTGGTTRSTPREIAMNWDQIAGSWKELQGKVCAKWSKITDDDLGAVAGKRDQLAGILQHRYGLAKEQAEKELDDFIDAM
jgi:uncharacterized protein YjbJ (UPF0337 family)